MEKHIAHDRKYPLRGLLAGCLVLLACLAVSVRAQAANAYIVNGVTVHCDDFTSAPGECWAYANNLYNKIWGQRFDSSFDSPDNMLKDLPDGELTLTPERLQRYVTAAPLGSVIRICSPEYLHAGDGWGHSQILVQKDPEGFTVLQGGLTTAPYYNEEHYTWEEFCSKRWLGGRYPCVKYIKRPAASGTPAVSGPASAAGSMPVITGANSPGTLTAGSAFSLSGFISCGETLTEVTVGCFDDEGTMRTGRTVHPGTRNYNIRKVDADVRFGRLNPGIYRYQVRASSSAGTTVLVDQVFAVISRSRTVPDGSYVLNPLSDSSLAVGISGNLKEAGAAAELAAANGLPGQVFDIHYEGNGSYTLRNEGSGLYLEAPAGTPESSTVRQQQREDNAAQRWQILPAGKFWCLVPESGNALCLDLGSSAAAGTSLVTSASGLTATQKFSLGFSNIPAKNTKLTDPATGAVYQVIKPGLKVAFAGFPGKQIQSVKIPRKVVLEGRTYRVTAISAGAFQGSQSLKKVVVPKSVTSIRKNAFYDCKNLTSLIIRTGKLKSDKIGRDAFRGAGSGNYRKLKVKVPAKRLDAYLQMFREKGLSAEAKFGS